MDGEFSLLRKTLNNPHKVGLFFVETLEVFSYFRVIDAECVEFIGLVEQCEYTDIGNKINVFLFHNSEEEYGLLFEFTDSNSLYDYALRTSIEKYLKYLIRSITDENNFLEVYFINYKKKD